VTLPLDRHWKNVSWLLSVEVFYGVALALISMVAVIPVFLSNLGATNTVIGALPVIWLLATSFPGAFASHFTAGLTHRKRAVIILHLLSGVPWVFLAVWFGMMTRPSGAVDIVVLIAGWGASWIIMGFTIPVWINFIGKVTRPELRARTFGTIFFFQTLMGVLGGWVGSRLLGSSLPFPANYALGFLVASVCMGIGSFFFIPVREDAGATTAPGPAFGTVLRYAREILANRTGLRVYLAVLVLSVGRFLLITYYPVFAESRFSLQARDSAIYTAICMAGQMIGSILAGFIGDRFGYARVAVVAMAALTVGLSLAMFGNHSGYYYVTAFVLGIFIVSDVLALFNLSMAYSPHEDNTAYIGIIPAIVAPFTALAAGSSGTFIDRFGFMPVAWVGLAGAVAALYLVVFRLPEPAYSLAGRRGTS
jgi:predicted MFS family arabinose efflux permease